MTQCSNAKSQPQWNVWSCMIERATVLRCENVNNQTFILHPGLMKMMNDEDEFMVSNLFGYTCPIFLFGEKCCLVLFALHIKLASIFMHSK